MTVTPWVVGQTAPIWSLTWPNLDLTGATVTARISVGGTPAAAAGVITVTWAKQGAFTFAPAAGDFATAGTATIQFKAAYAGGVVEYADPFTIAVVAAV